MAKIFQFPRAPKRSAERLYAAQTALYRADPSTGEILEFMAGSNHYIRLLQTLDIIGVSIQSIRTIGDLHEAGIKAIKMKASLELLKGVGENDE